MGRTDLRHRAAAALTTRWAVLAPLLVALVLAAVALTPIGAPHGTLAMVLAAAASALAANAGLVLALLALVVLLAAAAPHPAPAFAVVPPSRQQDPTTPGRPQPRAPGATSLPCAR